MEQDYCPVHNAVQLRILRKLGKIATFSLHENLMASLHVFLHFFSRFGFVDALRTLELSGHPTAPQRVYLEVWLGRVLCLTFVAEVGLPSSYGPFSPNVREERSARAEGKTWKKLLKFAYGRRKKVPHNLRNAGLLIVSMERRRCKISQIITNTIY